MQQILPIEVKGHVLIKDDQDKVLLDQNNAVHPQNISRVIARALSNETNYHVHRIAFGNGGTVVDAAYQITYKTPNDGQSPDPAEWRSRLYSETYSEVIDDSSAEIGTGEGSNQADDPASIEHVSGPGVRSNELGLTSEVVVEVVLNPGEPSGQFATDGQTPVEDTESDFTFDEIGLFTTGAPDVDLAGYQNVSVGDKRAWSDTGLVGSTAYTFTVFVDGTPQTINFTTPATGSGTSGEILYSDIIPLINGTLTGASASISDGTNQTYGFFRITSNSVGATSSILINDETGVSNWLFENLIGYTNLEPAEAGADSGVANDPTQAARERERMLTHIIFSPVLKSANRTLTITYTLTVSVARSV